MAAIALSLSLPVFAQVVDLGATGEDGPLIVTTDTVLAVPPDGVIHATEIQVAAGATLSFTPNAANTGIILTSIGDVVINGTITVDGQPGVQGAGGAGGPGGLRGGVPAPHSSSVASGGQYPLDGFHCLKLAPESCSPIGGGRGGNGSYWVSQTPGSNCTLGNGGGGGGGHLYITSNRSISGAGFVSSKGGVGGTLKTSCGGVINSSEPTDGSGGAITLMAPRLNISAMTAEVGYQGKLHLRTLDVGSAPTVLGFQSSVSMGNTLISWRPSPSVAVRITSLNGVPVEPAETLAVTVTTNYTTATVEATGCDRAKLYLQLAYRSGENVWRPWSSVLTIDAPSLTETGSFASLGSPASGQTLTVKAFASCQD